MQKLGETIVMMESNDYRERFKAEYYQTKIRYEKLKAFNNKIEAAEMTMYNGPICEGQPVKKIDMPKHDCPNHLLREQQSIMGSYLHILEVRAVIEGIEL